MKLWRELFWQECHRVGCLLTCAADNSLLPEDVFVRIVVKYGERIASFLLQGNRDFVKHQEAVIFWCSFCLLYWLIGFLQGRTVILHMFQYITRGRDGILSDYHWNKFNLLRTNSARNYSDMVSKTMTVLEQHFFSASVRNCLKVTNNCKWKMSWKHIIKRTE